MTVWLRAGGAGVAKDRCCSSNASPTFGGPVRTDTDLDTLAVALYVTLDDALASHHEMVPPRPASGFQPRISDAEILTLAVLAQLQGFTSERRWLRFAHAHLRDMFPYLPGQSGYNKHLRKLAGTLAWAQRLLARHCQAWHDDLWLADSTPIECGRSVDTVKRSALAGYAEYGYCASHSRWFWGLRLHLVTTTCGLPILWAVTGARASERDVLDQLTSHYQPTHGWQTLIADKGYASRDLEQSLHDKGIHMLRPARRNEPERPGARYFKPFRQIIESVNATLKTHLDIEHHRGRTLTGLTVRITAALLALTAAIWHNDHSHAPTLRSLTPYDH